MRAVLRVSYDSNEQEWKLVSEQNIRGVAPGGVVARSSTKKDIVREGRKTAKKKYVRPSKLVIENKNWSSHKDQRTHRYD